MRRDKGGTEPLMDALAVAWGWAQELGGRAGDPTPDNARQLIVSGAQPLRFAFGDLQRVAAVPAHEHQGGLPDLSLVRHHDKKLPRRRLSSPDANDRRRSIASRAIYCYARQRHILHAACAGLKRPYNPGAWPISLKARRESWTTAIRRRT